MVNRSHEAYSVFSQIPPWPTYSTTATSGGFVTLSRHRDCLLKHLNCSSAWKTFVLPNTPGYLQQESLCTLDLLQSWIKSARAFVLIPTGFDTSPCCLAVLCFPAPWSHPTFSMDRECTRVQSWPFRNCRDITWRRWRAALTRGSDGWEEGKPGNRSPLFQEPFFWIVASSQVLKKFSRNVNALCYIF